MSKLSGLATTWNTIKEIDLRPLRQAAMKNLDIVLTGRTAAEIARLAEQMRRDPSRPGMQTNSPLHLTDLDSAVTAIVSADLVIILIDAKRDQPADDFSTEKTLVQGWSSSDQKVLVFFNHPQGSEYSTPPGAWFNWRERRVVYGSVDDVDFLQGDFSTAIMDLLSDDWLALGRNYPLFRQAIANQLINDTCLSNAAYALSTGLAEIIPALDLPLNITDFFVLTKAQAFIVYKLGLALGLSLNWHNYMTEFGGALGVGYLWRQLARSLVGLIPAYGLVPKVGIAYAGTYVSGHAVYQWYLTGRHISSQQMRRLYSQAVVNGKQVAQSLVNKMPRPKISRPKLNWFKRKAPALPDTVSIPPDTPLAQLCENCGQSSASDASFCQYCGLRLVNEL
jgi:uncharacterized protein (DUF697 family)